MENHEEQAEEDAHHLCPRPEGRDQKALGAHHLQGVPEELSDSMPRRLLLVIEHKGEITKY